MIIKHKQQCLLKETTSIKTSPESHLNWKNHFHQNPLYFGMYAGIEADNENDNSSTGNKTNSICKQNPVCNAYRIVSELEEVVIINLHSVMKMLVDLLML